MYENVVSVYAGAVLLSYIFSIEYVHNVFLYGTCVEVDNDK